MLYDVPLRPAFWQPCRARRFFSSSGRCLVLGAQFEKGGYSDHAAYNLSKLLNIMFSTELARKAPPGLTCHALDPGTVNTKMLRAGWGMSGINVKR